MDPHRSTKRETPLGFLNVIQRGGTEDWKGLYEKCREPEVAAQVAKLLRLADPDLVASAQLWKFLLEDLHTGLEVYLEPS